MHIYRIALAGLFGLPDRIDWKACAQSEEEERTDAAAFKAAFATFDPSQ
jgi:CWF19-like protein 1